MWRIIKEELVHHFPFTLFGALSGIVIMIMFQYVPQHYAYPLFYVFHPVHVLLSAMVTAALFSLHSYVAPGKKKNIWVLLVIGYVGSVGIATLSDSLIPFVGEMLLNMPHRRMHIGFIEEWWIVNPLALAGIALAYFKPSTKFPHAGHVLISTWASLFHMIMARDGAMNMWGYAAIFGFLVFSVWVPCCISDIVFPLLFVKKQTDIREAV